MAMTRRLERKKPKKTRLPPRTFRRAGELTDEPDVDDLDGSGLSAALNYYSYVDLRDGPATRREWVLEFMTSDGSFSSDEVESCRKMEDWRITSLAGTSRILSRGANLGDEALERHRDRIREALVRFRRKRDETAIKKAPTEYFPPARSEHRAIAEAELAIDAVLAGNETDFSAYDYLVRTGCTRGEAIALGEYYRRVDEEYALIRKDPQLKEGYSKYPAPLINRLRSLVRSIVDGAERYVSNRRAATVRKPRKKREVAASRLVEKVQYMKEYPDLQVVSIDPARVVGATEVWLYSTRYKTLRRLVGDDGSLTVRGSTVHGFDPSRSEQKTLRKPADGIRAVLDGTPYTIRKLMSTLGTKGSVPNGRINSETVILRAVR